MSRSVPVGSPATFSCIAGGNPPPQITWLFNTVVISGARQTTYTIAAVAAGDAGMYMCVATNSIGIASSSASLTVLCESGVAVVIRCGVKGQVRCGIKGHGVKGQGCMSANFSLLQFLPLLPLSSEPHPLPLRP